MLGINSLVSISIVGTIFLVPHIASSDSRAKQARREILSIIKHPRVYTTDRYAIGYSARLPLSRIKQFVRCMDVNIPKVAHRVMYFVRPVVGGYGIEIRQMTVFNLPGDIGRKMKLACRLIANMLAKCMRTRIVYIFTNNHIVPLYTCAGFQ